MDEQNQPVQPQVQQEPVPSVPPSIVPLDTPQNPTVTAPAPQPPDQATVDAMLAVMRAEAAQTDKREATVKGIESAASHGFLFRYVMKLAAPFTPEALAESRAARVKAVILGLIYLVSIVASFWGGSLL